jgi:predicted nucleic acid-binding protein
MFLVDTSVWVEVFRKSSRIRLEEEIPLDQIATCLPIVQEVLQGFREDSAFRFARQNLLALPVVESPLSLDVFEMGAQLYRTGRRSGVTIRSGVDCLIAACALRNDLTVLHYDRDFKFLADIAPLQERGVVLRS